MCIKRRDTGQETANGARARAARESVHLILKKIGDRDPYITVLSRDVTRTKTPTTTQD